MSKCRSLGRILRVGVAITSLSLAQCNVAPSQIEVVPSLDVEGYPGSEPIQATEAYPVQVEILTDMPDDKKGPYPGPNAEIKVPTATPLVGGADDERSGWRRYTSESGRFSIAFPEGSYVSAYAAPGDEVSVSIVLREERVIADTTIRVSSTPRLAPESGAETLFRLGMARDVASAQALLDSSESRQVSGHASYLLRMHLTGSERTLFFFAVPDRMVIVSGGSQFAVRGTPMDDFTERRWWEIVETIRFHVD